MCFYYQVFFCIVIGAFAIGTAAPNLEKITTARAAAFMIWNLIDRVMTVFVALILNCFCCLHLGLVNIMAENGS